MLCEDKVAVITGGASGIGRETAKTFADRGAKVAICDVSVEEGNQVVDQIEQNGGQAEFVAADVRQQDQVKSAVETIEDRWSTIDVLINNAGITKDSKVLDMTEEQWDQVIDINLKGVFNFTQAVAPSMVEQGAGSIVNSSSVVAMYGNYGQTNYVASKAGVIGMTKVWARELGPKGITVNAVAPGFISTEMTQSVPDKVIDQIEGRTPLGRLGEPSEVARAYLFLASDAASFVNGTVLTVDGGLVV